MAEGHRPTGHFLIHRVSVLSWKRGVTNAEERLNGSGCLPGRRSSIVAFQGGFDAFLNAC